jgi:Mg2+-importing ATPase
MAVMVPVVFVINGFTKHNWNEAFLFAISVAVGLTPEMLPMIVSANLAKGAYAMSKKKTIVKNLNSTQNFGAMDILCTDKTGTITQDKIILEYHLNVNGNEDPMVLKYAYLNSYYQTGLKNLMDISIINCAREEDAIDISNIYKKIDEIPFDFERRRMSVAVKNNKNHEVILITKGAIEEMLAISKYAEYNGEIVPITKVIKDEILKQVAELNEDGMRVLGIARKLNLSNTKVFSKKDETDMILTGYLAFLDPPKESALEAIKALKSHGVQTKVLTGDNDAVTISVCRQVGIKTDNVLLGTDVEKMSSSELKKAVEKTSIFAKLTPEQKTFIIEC